MHVQARTPLSLEEVARRLASLGRRSPDVTPGRRLIFEESRRPPKFYLLGMPMTLPAAAEVAVGSCSQGRAVVLRMMWGPLPAPFPRVLSVIGLMLAVLIVAASEGTAADWLAAVTVALLPAAAMWYQRCGERELQRRLSDVLDGIGFVAKSR